MTDVGEQPKPDLPDSVPENVVKSSGDLKHRVLDRFILTVTDSQEMEAAQEVLEQDEGLRQLVEEHEGTLFGSSGKSGALSGKSEDNLLMSVLADKKMLEAASRWARNFDLDVTVGNLEVAQGLAEREAKRRSVDIDEIYSEINDAAEKELEELKQLSTAPAEKAKIDSSPGKDSEEVADDYSDVPGTPGYLAKMRRERGYGVRKGAGTGKTPPDQ